MKKSIYKLPNGMYECIVEHRYIVQDSEHYLATTVRPIADDYAGTVTFFKDVEGIKKKEEK